MKQSRVVIFTDLDGTLLDHDTYSYEPVLPVLKELEYRDFPVIPVTSKTRLEVANLRQSLNLTTPFVVENGAAIYFPESLNFQDETGLELSPSDTGLLCKSFSLKRDEWQGLLDKLKDDFPSCFQTFSELGVKGIAEATGLSFEQANLANQREFSEPVLWLSDEPSLSAFKREVERLGYIALQGGRFIHITNGYDKGLALNWLMERYRYRDSGLQWRSVALGDSGNDLAMLLAADDAVWVKSPVKSFPKDNRLSGPYYTKEFGPHGWVEAIEKLVLDSG